MKNIKYQSKGATPQSVGTFSEAFRQAKNSGVKTFMWKGKKYNTKTKEEVSFNDYTRKTKTTSKKKKTTNINTSAYMSPKYKSGGFTIEDPIEQI